MGKGDGVRTRHARKAMQRPVNKRGDKKKKETWPIKRKEDERGTKMNDSAAQARPGDPLWSSRAASVGRSAPTPGWPFVLENRGKRRIQSDPARNFPAGQKPARRQHTLLCLQRKLHHSSRRAARKKHLQRNGENDENRRRQRKRHSMAVQGVQYDRRHPPRAPSRPRSTRDKRRASRAGTLAHAASAARRPPPRLRPAACSEDHARALW